jgi:hypothetical protein
MKTQCTSDSATTRFSDNTQTTHHHSSMNLQSLLKPHNLLSSFQSTPRSYYLSSRQQDKSTMDFTGFPLCSNGDTLIALSPNHALQLHSEILKRHSKFFKEHISQENAATLSSSVRHSNNETVRWRFDLLDKPELDKEGAGRLVLTVS